MILGLLMKAVDIPIGSTVTMRTGEKPYTITDKLRVFDAKAKAWTIPVRDGARFLVHDADVNVVSSETVLLWRATDWEIKDYLEGEQQ